MAGRVVRRRRRPSIPDELFACRRRSLRLRLHRLWSELQGDLLELILEKLDLADHARFASVCSSWRSVAVENPPINKPLYLALSHDPDHLVRRFITSFIPSWKEAWFIGAGLDGWLVIVIDRKHLFLVNKTFNSIIPLPHPPQDPENFLQSPEFCKAALSSPPSSSSSGECTVVLRDGNCGDLFYCRLPSDKSFSKLSDTSFIHRVKDVLFYKGKLYVLCIPDTIVVFDHLLNKALEMVIDLSIIPVPLRLLISGNKVLAVPGGANLRFALTVNGNNVLWTNLSDNLLLLINRYCSLSFKSSKEHKEFRRTNYSGGLTIPEHNGTFVLDTSKDPSKAKVDDPWPLFFVMFNHSGIKR